MKNYRASLINNNFVKYWLPFFLWAGFIYYLSDQQSLKSSLEPMWDMILRKIAHLTEFAVLTFLLSRLVSLYNIEGKKFWFIVLSLALFYSVYDEVHQSYVQGRYGTVRDMIIDFNGAFLGVIVWNFYKLKEWRKKR